MPPRKRKQQAAEPMASASDVDPAKMKVAELKEELEKRGLDSTGKKADLVSRLEDALNSSNTYYYVHTDVVCESMLIVSVPM